MEQQYRSREEQEQAQYIRVSLTLAEYIADYINRELLEQAGFADDVVDESLILDALDTWLDITVGETTLDITVGEATDDVDILIID